MTKKCIDCHVEKPLDQFDKKSSYRDGCRPFCKECRRRKYYENHEQNLAHRRAKAEAIKQDPILHEEKKRKSREYYHQNKEKILEKRLVENQTPENIERMRKRASESYERNKEGRLARERARRKANPETYRARRKANRQKNLAKRQAQEREYSKMRRETDIQYRLKMNLRNRIRLSLINKSDCTMGLLGCPIEDFVAHLQRQFSPEMSWDNYGSYWSIDHIKPCRAFNLEDPEQQKACFHWTNCRPLPVSENSRKGATTDREFTRGNGEESSVTQ